MQANALTPGIVFAIDELRRASHPEAAGSLIRSTGLHLADPADRAVVHALKAEGSIDASTVKFIKDEQTKVHRRRAVKPPMPKATRKKAQPRTTRKQREALA